MAESKKGDKEQPMEIPMEDDSSSDSEVEEYRKTTIEEREYGTIPGSDEATRAALAHHGAYGNPVVGRGPLKKKKKAKKPKEEEKK